MWLQETLSAVGGAKWDITRYSKVEHSFTSWNASGRYHPRADGRSWDAMTVRTKHRAPQSPVLLQCLWR